MALVDIIKEFDINDFRAMPNALGRGSYGEVILCKHKDNNATSYAVKYFQVSGAEDDKATKNSFVEARKLFGEKHPNIIEVFGIIKSPGFFGILMEYAPCKNLESLFLTSSIYHSESKTKYIPLLLRLSIIKEIVEGLIYLHTKKELVHRDLKLQNILLFENLHVKIGDFGTSKFACTLTATATATDRKLQGTPVYISPERFADPNKKPSPNEDMYSFGLICFEIIMQTPCAPIGTNIQITLDFFKRGGRPKISFDHLKETDNNQTKAVCEKLKEMIESCWAQEQGLRWSASRVKEHLQKAHETEIQQELEKKAHEIAEDLKYSAYDSNTAIPLNQFDKFPKYLERTAKTDSLIITGGQSSKCNAVKFVISSSEWIPLPDLIEPRYHHCSVIFDDKLYVIGGICRSVVLDSMEFLDLKGTSNKWSSDVSNMNEKRFMASSQLFREKIYIFGGRNQHDKVLNTGEFYEVSSNQWTTLKESMKYERFGLCTFILWDSICCFGGLNNKDESLNNMDVFDCESEKFNTIEEKFQYGSSACVVKCNDDSFMVLGGVFKHKIVSTCTKYTCMKSKGHNWKIVKSSDDNMRMKRNRSSFTAALIDRKLYAVGGHGLNHQRSSLSTIEVLDLSADKPSWEILTRHGDMNLAGHSMVVHT